MRKKTAFAYFIAALVSANSSMAQNILEQISPACLTGNFHCIDFDFYAHPDSYKNEFASDHLVDQAIKNYGYRMADGVVRLDEFTAPQIGPQPFDKENSIRIRRERWLSLNGYNTSLRGDSIIPKGKVSVALASKVDAPLPKVTPACNNSCDERGTFGAYPGATVASVADLLIFRNYPNPQFEKWLAINGLTGSGITLNSPIEVLEFYRTR